MREHDLERRRGEAVFRQVLTEPPPASWQPSRIGDPESGGPDPDVLPFVF